MTCLGKADLLALLYVFFFVFLLLSYMVSWIRCGTCLYRSLIFASYDLTKNKKNLNKRSKT